MKKQNLIAAVVSAVIGVGALAATSAPAAADSLSFGLRIGGSHGSPAVGFGYSPYPRYEPYPSYGYRPYYPPVYRPAPRRTVEVCQPIWTTRKVHDRWGRVIKVVKVRDRQCRLVYR